MVIIYKSLEDLAISKMLFKAPTFLSKVPLVEREPRGETLGKKKVISEEEIENMVLPVANDVLGIAVKMLGFDRILVNCQDGHERLCRIRGKLKRRVWIRLGDIVLVSPWDFQSDKRGDIIWRYKRNQAEWLRNNGYLKI